MKQEKLGHPDPSFHYRAYDVKDVASLEQEGWVQCTEQEANDYWTTERNEPLVKAGLIAMKKRKAKR